VLKHWLLEDLAATLNEFENNHQMQVEECYRAPFFSAVNSRYPSDAHNK